MKQGRLRQQSDKRRKEAARRRAAIAAVVARDGPWCRAAELVPEVQCWGPTDAHEVVRRSRRPGSHLDPDLIILVCRVHHMWIDHHPDRAHDLGLERHSWE